jgi:hypothetical protein
MTTQELTTLAVRVEDAARDAYDVPEADDTTPDCHRMMLYVLWRDFGIPHHDVLRIATSETEDSLWTLLGQTEKRIRDSLVERYQHDQIVNQMKT